MPFAFALCSPFWEWLSVFFIHGAHRGAVTRKYMQNMNSVAMQFFWFREKKQQHKKRVYLYKYIHKRSENVHLSLVRGLSIPLKTIKTIDKRPAREEKKSPLWSVKTMEHQRFESAICRELVQAQIFDWADSWKQFTLFNAPQNRFKGTKSRELCSALFYYMFCHNCAMHLSLKSDPMLVSGMCTRIRANGISSLFFCSVCLWFFAFHCHGCIWCE